MNAKILIFLLFSVIYSCKKDVAKTQVVQKANPKEANQKIADSILQKSVFVQKTDNGLTRIWVKSNEKRGNFFYSDTLNILKISQYKFDNRKLSLIKEIDLEKTEWAYLEIDSANIKTKKIGKNNYVFLTHQVSNMGKAVNEQSVIFSMINVENIAENFNLQYFGYPSDYCKECIRGNFIENSKLKSSKLAKTALHQYAQTSTFIYHPSDEEKNISHYKNYAEKWEKDNDADNTFGAGYTTIPDKIYSTYYDENLFELTSASEDFVENEHYKIQSVFRGNLVGFDKHKRKYFPIIIESCSHFCNKKVQFLSPQKLKVTYEDEESFEIDVSKIVFK